MNTLSGSKVVSTLEAQHWHALIEEWTLAHERFARLQPHDPAYWYGERPQIGILAGAAWRCGYVAIEEFAMTKSTPYIDDMEEKIWRGRCDLWLTNGIHEHFMEAKHLSIELNDASVSKVGKSLQAAEIDSRNSNVHGQRSAVVFISARSKIDPSASPEFNAEVEQFLHALESLSPSMLAWCFPGPTRDLIGPAVGCHDPSRFTAPFLPQCVTA